MLFVGVNGVGKTTSIGKLAHKYKQEGKKVMLVAADTFRAGAVAQLVEWGRRVDVPVVTGAEKLTQLQWSLTVWKRLLLKELMSL
mgnify:FL=1